MIRLFPETRKYLYLGAVLGLILAVVLHNNGTAAIWCMAGFVCTVLLFWLAAVIAAGNMNGRILAILYVWLDAEKFIEKYSVLLKKAGVKDSVRFSLYLNLSQGHLAAGNYEKALSLLNDAPVLSGKRKIYAEAVLAEAKCNVFCEEKDAVNAEKEYNHLLSIEQYGKYTDVEILRIKKALLDGGLQKEDAEYIENQLEKNINPYRLLCLKFLLSQIYDMLGYSELNGRYLREIATAEGNIYIIYKARNLAQDKHSD